MDEKLLGTKVGRASRTLGQLWQVPVFVVGLAALFVVAATAPSRPDPADRQFQDDLERLRLSVESRQGDAASMRALADDLCSRAAKYPQHLGAAHYLSGLACLWHADDQPREQAAQLRGQAIGHLEKALTLELSEDDQAPLRFRLGMLLFEDNKDIRRAIELLSVSVEKQKADVRRQGYGWLVQAHLRLTPPDLEGALAASQKHIELLEDDESLARAWLQQADLHARRENRTEAVRTLDRVGAKAPKALRIEARLVQSKLCEEEGLWAKCASLWEELLQEAGDVPGGMGRVLFALASCQARMDPPHWDKAVQTWTATLAQGGPAAQAAALRLAELRLTGPAADADAALAHFEQALTHVKIAQDYRNPYLDLRQAGAIFDRGFRVFRENNDLEKAQQLATLFQRLAPPGLADERLAQVAEGMAKDLAAKAGDDPIQHAKVKAQYRKAGLAYEQAAQLLPDELRSEAFWRGAQCYRVAKDDARTAVVLERFKQTKCPDTLLAEGMLQLAEAYRNLGDMKKARGAYVACIAFPDTPFAYRARYELAVDMIQKKELEDAEETLKQNLKITGTTNDREAHEKSLYLLADLHLEQRNYDRARVYLEECVRQYPNNAHALIKRDQLAECYRYLARQAEEKLKANPTEAHYQRTMQTWREKAAVTYRTLQDELERRASAQPPSPPELILSRRTALALADVRYELNDYAEAVRLYQKVQDRHRQTIESLEAFKGMYRCLNPLLKAESPDASWAMGIARASVKIAQAEVRAMDPRSSVFGPAPEMWTHAQWTDFLHRADVALNPSGASPAAPSPSAARAPSAAPSGAERTSADAPPPVEPPVSPPSPAVPPRQDR